MKYSQTVAIFLATLMLSVSGLTQAQSLKPPVESSRAAAFMDRDVFLATHRRDDLTGKWVLKSENESPRNIKSKSDVMGQARGTTTTAANGYPAPLAN